MKTILKRGEIIEKLKKYYDVSTLEIVKQTTLDFSNFHRCYVLIVHLDFIYQLVCIHLKYGWIEIVFGEAYERQCLVFERYLIEISRITCDKFDETINHEL